MIVHEECREFKEGQFLGELPVNVREQGIIHRRMKQEDRDQPRVNERLDLIERGGMGILLPRRYHDKVLVGR